MESLEFLSLCLRAVWLLLLLAPFYGRENQGLGNTEMCLGQLGGWDLMVGAEDLSPTPMRLQASTLGLASPHPASLLSVLSPEAMGLRQALSPGYASCPAL